MSHSGRPKKIFSKKTRRRLPLSLVVIVLIALALWLVPTTSLPIEVPTSFTPAPTGSLTASPPPLPTTTPAPLPTGLHGGRIVFTCTRGDFNQICLINRDGSGLLQLTDENANHYYPAMSPRGNALAFASSLSKGTFDLYFLVFSSSQVIQLTDEIGNVFSPDFSPDGNQLLFINRKSDGQTDLWVMDLNTQQARVLYRGPNYAGPNTLVGAAWSPNGHKIAMAMSVIQPYEYEVFVLDLESDEAPRQLPSGLLGIGGSLDWSPDGRYLLIAAGPPGDKDIFRLDVEAGGVVRLTSGGDNNSPAYSPDGEWIAFNSLRNGGQADLYVMRSDGSDLRQLTTDPEPDWQPQWEP